MASDCGLDDCHLDFPHSHGTDFSALHTPAAPAPEPKPEPTKQREGDQRLPQGGVECVQDLVIAAMEESKRVGQERYHSVLMTFNGRKGIQDVADEARDLMVYATQLAAEAAAARETLIDVVALALHTAYSEQKGTGPEEQVMTTSYQRVLKRQAEAAVDAIMGWVTGTITNQGWDRDALVSDMVDFFKTYVDPGKYTWLEISEMLADSILAGPK